MEQLSSGGKRSRKHKKKRCDPTNPNARRELRELRDIVPFLQTLKKIPNPSTRSIVLSHLDEDACEMLCGAIYNVFFNNRVPDKKKRRLAKILRPHAEPLTALSERRGNTAFKKKKLAQIGGGPLTTILGTAIPLFLSVLADKL